MISENLNEALNQIVGKFFALNRLFDRAMSVISVKHKALNSAKILHPILAHNFPLIADSVTELQQKRNMLSRYPATPEGNETYENPLQFYEVALEEFHNTEDVIEDALDLAMLQKDHVVKSFLNGLLNTWANYIETMENIVDVCKMYGDDPRGQQMFDDEIEHCITVKQIVPEVIELDGD